MPMMKLAATSIDQIPRDRDRVISTLLKYFHTDSLCLRAEDTDPVAGIQSGPLYAQKRVLELYISNWR